MVLTSVSPVLFTLWFKEFSIDWDIRKGFFWLIFSIVLIILAYLILKISLKKLEIIDIKVQSIGTADKEILSFIFAYLLPLIEVDLKILIFILVLFIFIIFTTHMYHFNPVFGLFGYHFYNINTEGGVSYILMSKKQIRKVNQISKVILVSDYILIDVSK